MLRMVWNIGGESQAICYIKKLAIKVGNITGNSML